MSILGMRTHGFDGPYAFVLASAVLTPSFWNAGARGDRTSSITISTTATLGGGAINNLIDGAFAANSTDSCWFNASQSSREIKFDFGSGVTKIINGFRWLQSGANTHGTWVLEGSNDDSTYTGIGASFTLGGSILVDYRFTNTTAYRYYKLRQTAGTTNSGPWLTEIEFSIADPAIGEVRDALEAGDRTASIATTTTATLSFGTINNLVDGAFDPSASGSAAFSAQSTREIKFDLGIAKVITEFLWLQGGSIFSSAVATHGTWVLEGSNDDSSYTGLGSSFTLGGAVIQNVSWANSTAYRYYKLRQTAGTCSGSPWLVEIEFKIT
ncbi:MAG: hypothetical protein E5W82_10805 [Mesorhizobium sp.]|nr:MAG: hypothetical protein E5W82_10805 [Mesorhizobium sp.]